MKNLKKILCLCFTLIAIFLNTLVAYATGEQPDGQQLDEVLDELYEDIDEGIDDEINSQLEDEGIDASDPSSVLNVKTENIFEKIITALTGNIKDCFGFVGKIIALILLCTVVTSYIPQEKGSKEIFSFVSVVCAMTVIMSEIQSCIDNVIKALGRINTFMTCYIPVYSGVILTGGNATSATAYNVAMFSICEVLSFLVNSFIMPIMSIALCLGIVGAINPDFSFGKIVDGIKKAVQWVLGAIMTIVVAVLGIQSIIGASADTVATKTARYAVSTFVPVIGGSVSEAFLTVKSSLGVIRSGLGGIGIIIVLFITIQPLTLVLALKFSVFVCQIIADALDQKSISSLMSNMSSMLSICLSTVVSVSVVFIISTALVMLVCANSI